MNKIQAIYRYAQMGDYARMVRMIEATPLEMQPCPADLFAAAQGPYPTRYGGFCAPLDAPESLDRFTDDFSWPFVPSWDDAPDWAQWLAQDQKGTWWWFRDEPAPDFDLPAAWIMSDRDFCHDKFDVATRPLSGMAVRNPHGWCYTLQRRPEVSA
jgi:hypothetical protein